MSITEYNQIHSYNLGHLEKYLRHFDNSVELEEKLAAVTTACEVEHQGSTLLKDITILVI